MRKSINFTQTKEERARRKAQAKGNAYTQTKDCAKRWAGRERADEQYARSMGLNLTYDGVRSHNARLYR